MKPWQRQGWVIPPQHNGTFVAGMEKILEVYKRPFDEDYPVVCMDESPRQLTAETRAALPASAGRPARYDHEYRRCGVYTLFLACEPLQGKRMVCIKEKRTKREWASFLEDIAASYEEAEKITLVMDTLNTHQPGSLYESFPPQKAKALWDRCAFVYTPKHGSWLNIAEIELRVLAGQCLNRRMDSIETVKKEVAAWQASRNNQNAKVNWQFTTEDARIKLRRLYPSLDG